jgi:hypothetical protein
MRRNILPASAVEPFAEIAGVVIRHVSDRQFLYAIEEISELGFPAQVGDRGGLEVHCQHHVHSYVSCVLQKKGCKGDYHQLR